MRVMWNVVAGTGTNACYMEHLDKVLTWDGDFDEPKRVSWIELPGNDSVIHLVVDVVTAFLFCILRFARVRAFCTGLVAWFDSMGVVCI